MSPRLGCELVEKGCEQEEEEEEEERKERREGKDGRMDGRVGV